MAAEEESLQSRPAPPPCSTLPFSKDMRVGKNLLNVTKIRFSRPNIASEEFQGRFVPVDLSVPLSLDVDFTGYQTAYGIVEAYKYPFAQTNVKQALDLFEKSRKSHFKGYTWLTQHNLKPLKTRIARVPEYVRWVLEINSKHACYRSVDNDREIYVVSRDHGHILSYSVGTMAHDYKPISSVRGIYRSPPHVKSNGVSVPTPDFLHNLLSQYAGTTRYISHKTMFTVSAKGKFQASKNDVVPTFTAALAYQSKGDNVYGKTLRVEFYQADSSRSPKSTPPVQKLGKAFGHVTLSDINSMFLAQPRLRFAQYMSNLTHAFAMTNAGVPEHCSTIRFRDEIIHTGDVSKTEQRVQLHSDDNPLFPGRRVLAPPEVFCTWTRFQQALYLEKLRSTYFSANNIWAFHIAGLQGPFFNSSDAAFFTVDTGNAIPNKKAMQQTPSKGKMNSFTFAANYYVIVASCIMSSVMVNDVLVNHRRDELTGAIEFADVHVQSLFRSVTRAFRNVALGKDVPEFTPRFTFTEQTAPLQSIRGFTTSNKTTAPPTSFLADLYFPHKDTPLAAISPRELAGFRLPVALLETQAVLITRQLQEARGDANLWVDAFSDANTYDAVRAVMNMPTEPPTSDAGAAASSSSSSPAEKEIEEPDWTGIVGGRELFADSPPRSEAVTEDEEPTPQPATDDDDIVGLDVLSDEWEPPSSSSSTVVQEVDRDLESEYGDLEEDNPLVFSLDTRKRGVDTAFDSSFRGDKDNRGGKRQRDRIEAAILAKYPRNPRLAKFVAARLAGN